MGSIRHAITAATLALGGCLTAVGDGAFGVTGTLPANAGPCELFLLSEHGAEVPSTRRRVQGEFREDFTVAPSPRVYQVRVLCGGTMSKSQPSVTAQK